MRYLSYDALNDFVRSALARHGVPTQDAGIAAECLLYANLSGVDSHGIVHLAHYLRRLKKGSINPIPSTRYAEPRSGILRVDGRDGLGHVVTARAIDRGIEICSAAGSVAIVVSNSSHFGMAAYHVRRITEANMVGMVMTHTDARIVPTGSKKPFVGTNPIAFGFPSSGEPVILDMATSSVPFGKISVAKTEGRRIPLDWGLDEDGEPTSDPSQVVGLHPIAGHKGSGLAMMIDLFSSMFSGMAFGPQVSRMFEDLTIPRKLGHFIALWDIGSLLPIEDLKRRVDSYVAQLHAQPQLDGKVPIYFPGELEAVTRVERLKSGIPIQDGLLHELIELGERLELDCRRLT